MSSSQDGTTSPKSLFGWYKEHITGAIASFAALTTIPIIPNILPQNRSKE